MAAPRLIKLTCPECGAALSVDAGAEIATCRYCKKSAYVHWPDKPARPAAPAPEYGNIHVSHDAIRAAGTAMVVMTLVPIGIVVAIGVVVAIVAVTSTNATTSRIPQLRLSMPGGPACERAVACCRALSPTNTSCDGMRLLGEAECDQQAKQLGSAARALGKSCK